MSPRNDRFGSSKFKSREDDKFERRRNVRDEKHIKEELPKIVFSFKDFDIKQIPPGQSYGDWQEEKLLAYMIHKFEHVCGLNVVEAQQQKVLTIYDEFPDNTDFKQCEHINDSVKWAVIRNIKGQTGRVAGHIIGNVFYVVFLDQHHRFFITEKKNT